MAELRFVCHYLHRAAAEHERRTDKDGIAYLRRGGDAVFYIRDGAALRLRDAELLQHLFKAVTVFRALYRLAVRAYHLDASVRKRLS